MTKKYFYRAYGLNISSTIFFPELLSINSSIDVKIHSEGYEFFFQNIDKPKKSGLNEILFSTNDILYILNDEPLFRIRYGKEIIFNPNSNVDIIYLRHLILNRGIATLLRQRGYLVLHASAVNMKGGAVVFLGWGGDGKSTIAAALNRKGYQFITDDVLKIDIINDEPLAIPSFPRAKLWGDIINYMEDKPSLSQKIHPEIDKYSYDIVNMFFTDPLPLKMIYILENSFKNDIITLKPQNALMELINSSYVINGFGISAKKQNLNQCAKVVNSVPVKRLKKLPSLTELENLIKIIEKDVFRFN